MIRQFVDEQMVAWGMVTYGILASKNILPKDHEIAV
jgi:hypothetical protein